MANDPGSSKRLYLGNLPRDATKQDIEDHFKSHGHGDIVEVKLMNGFGFIEYKDAMDARDIVPEFHGSDFMGQRLTVQFARGSRQRTDAPYPHERPMAPRPRRTQFRMTINGLPEQTSWQDLKDFARGPGCDVVYSEVSRERDGRGFVEYETAEDLRNAVGKLDGGDFKDKPVSCTADIQAEIPRPRERFRSRSPHGRRPGGYGPPGYDEYDRRGPPRGYSPREDYRRRSPPPRDYYDSRDRYAGRSPPRARGPPVDDYPPRARYPAEDPYDTRTPPVRRYDADPYVNGRAPYERPVGGARPRSPPPRAARYEGSYERRGYW